MFLFFYPPKKKKIVKLREDNIPKDSLKTEI